MKTVLLTTLLVPAALLLAGSAATAPPPAPVASCSPGPSNCFEWHRAPVTVSWSWPGCGPTTISNDTAGTPVSCTASNVDGSTTSSVNVRKDSTPPAVSGKPERGPDNNGWYNRSLRVEFEGDDGASGVAGCTSTTYSGPDNGSAAVSGTCTDNAGNTGTGSFVVKYDATPPSVEAKPDREPNANGWYNRAVTVTFVGADPTSGVDSCTPPVQYKGPDAEGAQLSGTCQDKAANTSSPVSVSVRYDTKPPTLGRVKAEISGGGIALSWVASKDAQAFSITRRPGLRGSKPAVLYQGAARSFVDRRLTKGLRYRYTVTAFDQAGNSAARGLQAQAVSTVSKPTRTRPARVTPALLGPRANARLAGPPVLRWTRVPRATYYNVQLYRDGRKILTAWPTAPSFRLQSAWRFGGTTHRLRPGTYRWYVWPGFGPRSANRYGKLVGTRRFTVLRT